MDAQRRPGGGGLLIFEAASYAEALEWVQQDPMIGQLGELDVAAVDPRQRGWLAMSRCTSPA